MIEHRRVPADELPSESAALFRTGFRLGLVAAHDDGPYLCIVYLFLAGTPDRRIEVEIIAPANDPQLPSLAEQSFPAGRFEREMHDLYGVIPVGHPLPRRLVRHAHWPSGWYPTRSNAGPPPEFADIDGYPFLTVDGPGVYEIPVGPVHAGLIEPGHFRFSVVGETILKLKARLWFTHRGVEKLLENRSAFGAVELAERISSDTAAGHTLAHSLAIEDALGNTLPEPTQRRRAIVVELERLYNYAADLGALANDVGFSLANAHALHVRERLLRINGQVTGHRLLRGAIRPGGVALRSLTDPVDLADIGANLADIATLTLKNTVIRDRFTGTAVLERQRAKDLGCLGYVARASGLSIDARIDHPFVPLPVTPISAGSGDVLASYIVRRDEFAASTALIAELVADARELSYTADSVGAAERRSGIGIVEGWRGTIVHRIEINTSGHITRAKIVDPSWFNWRALPGALTDTIVPDFPWPTKASTFPTPATTFKHDDRG